MTFPITFCSCGGGIRELSLNFEILTAAMVDLEAILVLKKGEVKQLKSKIGS